jgi:hypothetical protein
MATAAWKRPGSPIGKKGPRKSHPKYKRHAGEPWESAEIRELKSLATGHAGRRHQPKVRKAACGHSQQGAARGDFASTSEPVSLQPAKAFALGRNGNQQAPGLSSQA